MNLVHLRGQWWLQWGETVVEPGNIRQDPKPRSPVLAESSLAEPPSQACSPPVSVRPLAPSLPAGGHPGDGGAVLRPLGAPGHGDHQQQRPDHLQRAEAPAPGGGRVPREDGGQVRPRTTALALPAEPLWKMGPSAALFWASSLPEGREKMAEVILRFSGPNLSSDPVAR